MSSARRSAAVQAVVDALDSDLAKALAEPAGLVNARRDGKSRIYSIDAVGALGRFERTTESIRRAITVRCPPPPPRTP